MTARKARSTRRAVTAHAPAAAAVQVAARELAEPVQVTAAEGAVLAEAAVAAAPATQVRRPWRSTIRTVFQLVVGLAPMVPVIVNASGLEQTSAGVAGALAISGGVTRVMALPQVEAFLQRFVPWLAASPRPAGT